MSTYLNERFQNMEAYTPGEQPKKSVLIKLNTNESPYPPSPKAVEAVSAAAVETLRLYSNIPATDLCTGIAEHYGVDAKQVIVGNGSDEILYSAILAFGGNGTTFPDITYGFYTVWADLFGYAQSIVPLKEDFSIDPDDYLTNRYMVIIANPNAPTGVTMSVSDIERIVQANPNQIVLIDEAYADFGAETAVPLIERYENLIITGTFSKSRSLAGGRLGYAIAQPEIIDDLNKMKFSLNPYNVNTLTQLAGTAAVRDEAYFEECRDKIMRDREYTKEGLLALGFTVLPSCANFLFAKPPRMPGAEYVAALRTRSILVRRFDIPRIKDFTRITIGTRVQMDALLTASAEILSEV